MSERIKKFVREYYPELICIFAVFICFAPGLFYEFFIHWDEGTYVVKNKQLDFTWVNIIHYFRHGHMGLWTPLTMISFMADYEIWGQSVPFGYRLTNMLLHSGCALIFMRILRHLNVRQWLVLLAGICWAVHPQRIESVVWIAERKDVLSGIFALWSIYAFMLATDKKRFPFAAILLYIIAVTAKPSVIGTPVAFIVYALWKNPEFFSWKRVVSCIALMFAGGGMVMYAMNFRPGFGPLHDLIHTIPHNFIFYAITAIFPFAFNPIYPFVNWDDYWIVPVFFAYFSFFFIVCNYLGIMKKFFVSLLFFGAVYCAWFAPAAGAFYFNPTDYADRYSYLTALVSVAFAVYLLEYILRERPQWINRTALICFIFPLMCGIEFFRYLPYWKEDVTLFSYAVERDDTPNIKAAMLFGCAGMQRNMPDKLFAAAEIMFRNAERTKGTRRHEGDPEAFKVTGIMFLLAGELLKDNVENSMKYFWNIRNYTMQHNITLIDPHLYLAAVKRRLLVMFQKHRPYNELIAFMQWSNAMKCRPAETIDYVIEGTLEYMNGHYSKAAECYRYVLSKTPDDANIRHNLRQAEQMMKKQKK